MKALSLTRLAGLAATSVAVVSLSSTAPVAALTKTEVNCSKSMEKAAIKVSSALAKAAAKCRDSDISGKTVGSCSPLPDKAQEKVDKAVAKVYKDAAKKCASTCSTASAVTCVSDLSCPPRGTTSGRCSGGGKDWIDVGRLGFPGYFCREDAILGSDEVRSSDDIALCVGSLASDIGNALIDNIYGSIDNGSAIDEAAADCLKEIAKQAPKAATSIAKAIGKCRDKQGALSVPDFDIDACPTADEKAAKSISKSVGKLTSAIDDKCSEAAILQLDLCGNGPGGTLTVEAAKTCLSDLVREAADSDDLPDDRAYVRATLINAAYPDSETPQCGDNQVNQKRNPFLLLGEECDGTDDSACPGQCGDPGDVFECTCLSTKRLRSFAYREGSDLDSGWTGRSHNTRTVEDSGFFFERTGCDCDVFDNADCVGSSSDPLCDDYASLKPICLKYEVPGKTCDEQGDNDGGNTDEDCWSCTADAANAGDYCQSESDCDARCFDNATDLPVAPQVICTRQSECQDGQTCRGRCDKTDTCSRLPQGPPLPLSSGGVAVCNVTTFFSDVFGTSNLYTGESEKYYELRTQVHLSNQVSVPCPVCGGVCRGGARDGLLCSGTCDQSGDPCRFDEDCTGLGDTACTEDSPTDCPPTVFGGDGVCDLSLICSSGANAGEPCRIEGESRFGTVTSDCPPDPDSNQTNYGIEVPFTPITSGEVELPGSYACTANGYENFTCPCPPGDGGSATKPNFCSPACNAPGPDFGVGCATNGGAGGFTVCTGGSDPAGTACDEDADCNGGGTCSKNPLHCTAGDPAKLHSPCTLNSNCDSSPGSGDGVCGDACPGGRCVPLCVQAGTCTGGDNDGFVCANNADCPAGGTCGDFDDEDGACAVGDGASCDGDGYDGVDCLADQVGTMAGCEYGSDGIQGTDDDLIGSGTCRARPKYCFLADPITGAYGVAEGGDTIKGGGTPTFYNQVTAFCIPPTDTSIVNNNSGLGGPGRLRQHGENVSNFTSLP